MADKKYDVYIPEDKEEEALMIMGRINAFAAYVRREKYNIARETCAAMLGFELDGK